MKVRDTRVIQGAVLIYGCRVGQNYIDHLQARILELEIDLGVDGVELFYVNQSLRTDSYYLGCRIMSVCPDVPVCMSKLRDKKKRRTELLNNILQRDDKEYSYLLLCV